MKRREFVLLFGCTALTWPWAAQAQAAMPLIGLLSAASPNQFSEDAKAFHQGLAERGFVEGRNVAIEYRWAEDHLDRLPQLAADLVSRNVAVIASVGATPAATAAKAATNTIPIVFQIGTDPVAVGLVKSLNRPGGNITGVTSLNVELEQKRLEVLHELLPSGKIMAVLLNGTNSVSAENQTRLLQAGRGLGLQLHFLHASAVREFDAVFASARELGAGGLVIVADPLFAVSSEQLAALSAKSRLPTISPYARFAVAGGLMSYGGSLTEQYRQVGVYTGRILKGEKPGNLPVQQITKIELIANLKAAKAMGIELPTTILVRADKVIE